MDDRQLELALYTVRHSDRATRVTLHIAPGSGLEVVVPRRYDARQIPALVKEHQHWIERRTRQLRRKSVGAPALERTPLPNQIPLAACRERWSVSYRHAAGAAPRLSVTGDRDLRLRADLREDDRAGVCLTRWCRRRASDFLTERLRALAEQFGLSYEAVVVRSQKRRWGSCSSRTRIHLNYKLIFLPPDLADYVMVHELCHTRFLDHSSGFWDLVARCVPDAAQRDRALNDAWRLIPTWVERP